MGSSRAFRAGAHLGARVASGDAALSGYDAGWMAGVAQTQGIETASTPLAVQNIPTTAHDAFRRGVARGNRIAGELGNTVGGGSTGNQGGAGGHQTPGSPGSANPGTSTSSTSGDATGGIATGGAAGSVGGTTVGGPVRGGVGDSSLAGSQAGGVAGNAPTPRPIDVFTPQPNPNGGGGNNGGNNNGSNNNGGGLGNALDNGSLGLIDVISSAFVLAAGLAALTAEGSTTMGKLQGGLMALSGALGLAYGANNLMGMMTGKYFLPDSIAQWGHYAAVANRALAMWEIGKMAFANGKSVWDKYKDKVDLGDLGKTLGIGGLGSLVGANASEAAEGNPAGAASGGESAEDISQGLGDLYDFNCLDAGRCFLPGTPSEIADANAQLARRAPRPTNDASMAYLDACRMVYPGEEPALWWDVSVCKRYDKLPAGTSPFDAAELGRADALAQLAKGDSYWAGCEATAPTPDEDGTFYANACGNRWVADGDNSGVIVPIWLLMENPNTARRLGAKFGSEYAVQILRAGHLGPNPVRNR